MGEMISIEAIDGSGAFGVYRATPPEAAKGAIVVIQEIFGINAGIKARVDRWASLGYCSYALDLFWRETPGIDLDPDVSGDFEKAIAHMQKFDRDKGIEDIEATIRVARAESGAKVGVTGYCLGGLLAYLSAARTDTDASVAYYGGGIHNFLNESHGIARPLMMHFAEQDHFIPPDAVEQIRLAFAGNNRVEVHSYPGVDHGFATEFGKRRDEAAATQADNRTRDFFAKHIG